MIGSMLINYLHKNALYVFFSTEAHIMKLHGVTNIGLALGAHYINRMNCAKCLGIYTDDEVLWVWSIDNVVRKIASNSSFPLIILNTLYQSFHFIHGMIW
jgi:hypothetical protein